MTSNLARLNARTMTCVLLLYWDILKGRAAPFIAHPLTKLVFSILMAGPSTIGTVRIRLGQA